MRVILAAGVIVTALAKAPSPTPSPSPSPGTKGSVESNEPPIATAVSLVALIADPNRFDGQYVEAIGVLHADMEDQAIYLSREDGQFSVTKNAIWFDVRPGFDRKSLAPLVGKFVLLSGTFDSSRRGHLGMYAGALRNVDRIEDWEAH